MRTAANTTHQKTPQTRTTRLDVAAFLLVRGFQIVSVDLERNTATFIFNDPDFQADSVIRDFYNNGQVSANAYADAQKRIRDLLWEAKRRAS